MTKRQEERRVSFRVEPSTYKLLEAAAKNKGLSVTAYVRMLAFDAAREAAARG